MPKLNRREFTKIMGAAGAVAGTSAMSMPAIAAGKGKVVIIGGGIGGSTVAHHIKKKAPSIDVVLITAAKDYTTCFFSNWYMAGLRSFSDITHDYSGLAKLGVKVVVDTAVGVDTAKKTVSLKGGGTESYDKLVVSPGIDFKWDTIEGYDAKVAEKIPHAWVGGSQSKILKAQLDAMADGATYIQAPPPNPFRCPPGPQERVSLIAYMFKKKKPKSKIITLDPKPKFSKGPAFMAAWKELYPGMITANLSTNKDEHFRVVKVDPSTNQVTTKGGEKFGKKGDVLNIIPAQKAGKIAFTAGLTEGDWCPIDPVDFSSTKAKDVHVLGDASIAKPMPKSGFSANSQAKVVAASIVHALGGGKKPKSKYRNTCYSAIDGDSAIKVGVAYHVTDLGEFQKVPGTGFVSKPTDDRKKWDENFGQAEAWYKGITADTFAKG